MHFENTGLIVLQGKWLRGGRILETQEFERQQPFGSHCRGWVVRSVWEIRGRRQMTTNTVAIPMTRVGSRQRTASARMPLRWALAVILATLGVLAILFERAARSVEVILASDILPLVFASGATPAITDGEPSIAFGYGEHWYAIRITAECSIAFYAGAIAIAGAAIVLVPKIRIVRVLPAVLISMAVMVALNQVRFVGLTYALGAHGIEVFDWAHTIGGSILMMAGITGCIFFFLMYVVRPSRHERKG